MIYLLQFIAGAILLYYGAELLINSAKSISYIFGVSKIIVGITIIAFGTSLPELFVSILAMFKNESDIVLGNVIGSNITNIGLVLGFTALTQSIIISYNRIKNDIIFMLLATFTASVALYFNALNYWVAILLIIGFMAYIYFMDVSDDSSYEVEDGRLLKSVILVLFSVCLLAYGSNLFIIGATGLATFLGVSQLVIGMTVVALGTSVPELATSIVSIKKQEYDFVIGNIIGSNIFNIILVLAVSLFINKIDVSLLNMEIEILFLIGLTVLVSFIIYQYNKLNRISGCIFLFAYFAFITLSYGRL